MANLKARSFECSASPSHIRSEQNAHRVKRNAWCTDGDLYLNREQLATMLSPQEKRMMDQIGTRIYGMKQIKG